MPFRADALARIPTRAPLGEAVAVHLLSFVVCYGLAGAPEALLPMGAWLALEGVIAAAAGRIVGMPWWWIPINCSFFPCMYLFLSLNCSPWWFFAAFGVLLLINGAAWMQRVPLFISSRHAAAAVHTVMPQREGIRVLDLGCGTGRLLVTLARLQCHGDYTGIEVAPLPYVVSRLRALRHRSLRVLWGNFWRLDFSEYDVVYAYLSPAPMLRLWDKARREMRPGSLLISNGFAVPDVPPDRAIALKDSMRSTLYVWRM